MITYYQVGPELPKKVVSLPYQKAVMQGKTLKGTIDILDVQYGNVWTNITDSLFNQLKPKYGDVMHTVIYHHNKPVYTVDAPYCQTFGAVAKGKPLAYLNSLLQYSLALNQGDFAKTYHIGSGNGWSVAVTKKGH